MVLFYVFILLISIFGLLSLIFFLLERVELKQGNKNSKKDEEDVSSIELNGRKIEVRFDLCTIKAVSYRKEIHERGRTLYRGLDAILGYSHEPSFKNIEQCIVEFKLKENKKTKFFAAPLSKKTKRL